MKLSIRTHSNEPIFSLRTSFLLDYCKWVKQIFVTLLLVIIAPYIFGQSKHKNTWSTMQLKGKTLSAILTHGTNGVANSDRQQ